MSAARMKVGFHMGSIVALSLLLVAGTPADSPVADAAERGDLEAVRTLLRDGADANGAQADGTTALHWAAMNDDVQIVEVLALPLLGDGPAATSAGGTSLEVLAVVAALIGAGLAGALLLRRREAEAA